MGHAYLKHLSWHWNGSINFQTHITDIKRRHPKLKVQIKDPREKERNSNILIYILSYILVIVWGSQAPWQFKRKSHFHRTKNIHGQLSIDGGVMCCIYVYFSWKLKAHWSKSFLLYPLTTFENCQASFLHLIFQYYWRLYKQEAMYSFSIN